MVIAYAIVASHRGWKLDALIPQGYVAPSPEVSFVSSEEQKDL